MKNKLLLFALFFLSLSGVSFGQDNITVDFSSDQGAATQRASGFLNGINSTAPVAGFVGPMKMKLYRGLWGYSDEAATYTRVVAQGATPELVLSDAWEYNSDGSLSAHSCYTPGGPGICPGDGGSWTSWDTFVTTTVTNLRAAGQTALQYDIWNEPDITNFWPRSEAQYQTMWQHAVNDIRAIDATIQIVGPSTCCQSGGDGWGTWVTDLLAFAKTNSVLPNI